jgi:hypothetical protein
VGVASVNSSALRARREEEAENNGGLTGTHRSSFYQCIYARIALVSNYLTLSLPVK